MSHVSQTKGLNVGFLLHSPFDDVIGSVTTKLNIFEEVNAKLESLQQDISKLIKCKAIIGVNIMSSHLAYYCCKHQIVQQTT